MEQHKNKYDPKGEHRIGILILNCNGKRWLIPLFDALLSNGYQNIQIYLVDNASDDGSVELTVEQYPEVAVIRMGENLGYSTAYNLTMPHAFDGGCEWVILANNDVRIEPDCLSELAQIAQSDSNIGVLGPAFLAWESDDPNYYMVGNHPYAIQAMKSKSFDPVDVEWVEGSFLMVSRRCFEAVGPLDPYLNFYWEEADFCRRARRRGWRVVLVSRAVARHYAGGSINQQNSTAIGRLKLRNYYIYKMTDPFQSFGKNLRDATYLLLVNLKAARSARPSSLIHEIRVFGKVIREIRHIYKKWARDRAGTHPSISDAQGSLKDVKVICDQKESL